MESKPEEQPPSGVVLEWSLSVGCHLLYSMGGWLAPRASAYGCMSKIWFC